ncbi:MAG: rod shape-determining protein MreD [Halanaerobiales bacterium]|nr:rod shape-determining protein MreD [Halanaerobiales bacterium]
MPWFGVKPDLLLIIAVTAGLLRGIKFGTGIGFLAGAFQDLFLGGIFGVLTIVKMVTGGGSGLIEGNFFKENYLFPSVIIFLATFTHEFLKILLSERLLFNINIMLALKEYILPEAILNSLLGIIVYYLLYRLDDPGGSYYG